MLGPHESLDDEKSKKSFILVIVTATRKIEKLFNLVIVTATRKVEKPFNLVIVTATRKVEKLILYRDTCEIYVVTSVRFEIIVISIRVSMMS